MAEAGAAEKIVAMKIAILGAGNMGGAIACGLVRSGACRAEEIVCTARTETTLERLRTRCSGIRTSTGNEEAVRDADLIVLAVKPWLTEQLVREIRRAAHEPLRISEEVAQLVEMMNRLIDEDAAALPRNRSAPGVFAVILLRAQTAEDEIHREDLPEFSVRDKFAQTAVRGFVPVLENSARTRDYGHLMQHRQVLKSQQYRKD